MIYVTDTHPLVFWASERSERLGKRARRIFHGVEQGRHSIIVPIAVLEETAGLVERKVIRLSVAFRRWAEELDHSANFQIQPYTIEILLESLGLSVIRDPADRAIVATARHLHFPLITADDVIRDGKWVDTVW
jgi:PIN domain nuclease of toxin-antitoxin system